MILKRLKWIAAFLAMIPSQAYSALLLQEATGIVSITSDALSQNTAFATAVSKTALVSISHVISVTACSVSQEASPRTGSLSEVSNSRITVGIEDPRIIHSTMYHADDVTAQASHLGQPPVTSDISSSGSSSYHVPAPSFEGRWKAVDAQTLFLVSLHTGLRQYHFPPYILQLSGSSYGWRTNIRPPPLI